MVISIDKKIEKKLRNAHYGIFNHSAVQICSWTKSSLRNENFCYKQKFYGIDCHRCMEFSPAAVFCENNCIFCWRPMEFMKKIHMKKTHVDEPKDIYENLLLERKKLLSGFLGNKNVDKKIFKEAIIPNHFAISLSGEPTLYPKLPELILFLRNLPQTKSIFLVTNAQEPGMLKKLERKNSLPTQLYISMNAPNEELFKKICAPSQKDAWKRFKKSLEIFSGLKTRRVIRMTMIKGMNMDKKYMSEYANLIKKANPHFIEIKSYMWIGLSRKRLKEENMPTHEEIKEFAKEFAKMIDFDIVDEKEDSRIVLLQNKKERIDRLIKSPIPGSSNLIL
jgi:tRNA wybutosine-synthesizing protein 1